MRLCNNNAPSVLGRSMDWMLTFRSRPYHLITASAIHRRIDHDGGRGDIRDRRALGRCPLTRRQALDPVKGSYVAVRLRGPFVG